MTPAQMFEKADSVVVDFDPVTFKWLVIEHQVSDFVVLYKADTNEDAYIWRSEYLKGKTS